jgi:hypothetical protein
MENGFIFYASFYEALDDLPDDAYTRLSKCILSYGITGEMTELKGYERNIFAVIKPQIDANVRRKNNGQNGGRPPKPQEEPPVPEPENPTPPNEKPPVSESENLGFADEEPAVSEGENQSFADEKAKFKYKDKEKEKPKEKENKKPNEKENSSASAETVSTDPSSGKKLPLIEREPTNNYERVEKRYLENWKSLFQQGKVKSAEPVTNWKQNRALLKNLLEKFQPVQINAVLDKAAEDAWILSGGYSLNIILSATVFNRFMNGSEKPEYQKPAAPKYQPVKSLGGREL